MISKTSIVFRQDSYPQGVSLCPPEPCAPFTSRLTEGCCAHRYFNILALGRNHDLRCLGRASGNDPKGAPQTLTRYYMGDTRRLLEDSMFWLLEVILVVISPLIELPCSNQDQHMAEIHHFLFTIMGRAVRRRVPRA